MKNNLFICRLMLFESYQAPAYQQRIQNWEILPFSMGIRHLENAKR